MLRVLRFVNVIHGTELGVRITDDNLLYATDLGMVVTGESRIFYYFSALVIDLDFEQATTSPPPRLPSTA